MTNTKQMNNWRTDFYPVIENLSLGYSRRDEHQKFLSLARFLCWNAFSVVSYTGWAFATRWMGIGHLFDRFRLYLSCPPNELASRRILWINVWRTMPGVKTKVLKLWVYKLETLMTNTKQRYRWGTAFYRKREKLSSRHSLSHLLGTNTWSS